MVFLGASSLLDKVPVEISASVEVEDLDSTNHSTIKCTLSSIKTSISREKEVSWPPLTTPPPEDPTTTTG